MKPQLWAWDVVGYTSDDWGGDSASRTYPQTLPSTVVADTFPEAYGRILIVYPKAVVLKIERRGAAIV